MGGLLALLALTTVLIGIAYYECYRVYGDTRPFHNALEEAQASLALGDIPPGDPLGRAISLADEAEKGATRAEPIFRLFRPIPLLGRPIEAVQKGVAVVVEESRAAAILRGILVDVFGEEALSGEVGQGNRVFHDGQADIGLIAGLGARLESLLSHLRSGDEMIRSIPSIPFVRRIDELKVEAMEQSEKAIRKVEELLPAVRFLPDFLGADRPRTYLLALQNNAELRATGGAMLAYAILRADEGKLSMESAGDLVVDPLSRLIRVPNQVQIPRTLRWYLLNIPWQPGPRSASDFDWVRINWINNTPDFPVVAQGWAAFAERITGNSVDGVIAVDPVAISKVLGDRELDVPSFPTPITGGNLTQVVENEQYRLPLKAQSRFPKQLMSAAWPVLSDVNPLVPTLRQFGAGLRQKHMQIWLADETHQALVRDLGWDGGLRSPPGDLLLPVITNLPWSKLDYFTDTTIRCNVEIDAVGGADSTCQVRLVKRVPPNEPEAVTGPSSTYGEGRSLVALYVPSRALPGKASYSFRPYVEQPARVLAREVTSSPAKDGVARFRYRVSDVITSTATGLKAYQVTIQHQPMVNPAKLVMRINLPDGSTIRDAPGWTISGRVATLNTVLQQDMVTRIVFE